MIDADLFVGCLLIDAVRPLGRRVGGVGVLFFVLCFFCGASLSRESFSFSLPFFGG
jgi:hypothetical protein